VKTIQAVRGMPDILPVQTPQWQWLEGKVRALVQSYGFQEIRLPIVESTALFSRSIGEVTDIVEKEMYTFDDRNGDSLTLRPEGTAGCVRAAVQHNLIAAPQRLWYCGPMFRHERPQRGRLRQFQQIGLESFGVTTPDADAELITLTARLWRDLGVSDAVRLELNSIGSLESRERFKEALVGYLRSRYDELDEDSQRRLDSNPLRILDSKNPDTQNLLNGAPDLTDFLDEDSRADFARLKAMLEAAGVPFKLNPRLVRGLDYYNKTVFEWTTDRLGAQSTICAGGRYDGLVAQLGGRSTPGVGFAMGVERVLLLCDELGVTAQADTPAIFAFGAGDRGEVAIFSVVEALRQRLASQTCQLNIGGGSMKSQLKRANKSGARFVLICGEAEAESGQVTLKFMQDDREQVTAAWESVFEILERELNTL
jgi:histidyl-tRNA synthetase